MSLMEDGRILIKLLRGMPTNMTHATRLEEFYGAQAESYDAFRERLLHGRQALINQLALPEAASIVELGGGTAKNIEFFKQKIHQIKRYEVVDLCPSLLKKAQMRAKQYTVIHPVEADACSYQPNEAVDCVIFSYSLTMIPDWATALQNAKQMLKPNGCLAVVDFTLSNRQPKWLAWFWRRWFAHDGVHLNAAHLSMLKTMFPHGRLQVDYANVPYLPFVKVPYYQFISDGHV